LLRGKKTTLKILAWRQNFVKVYFFGTESLGTESGFKILKSKSLNQNPKIKIGA